MGNINTKYNSFISILDLNEGAATGSCRAGDKVTFFIKSEKDKKPKMNNLFITLLLHWSHAKLLPS